VTRTTSARCSICGAPARTEAHQTYIFRLIDATSWLRLRCTSEPPHEWQVAWNPKKVVS
jgi:hypothetical protein